MKNLNFLNEGQIFPPLEEAKRIGACAEYDLMYDGNSYAVEEKHFRQTLNNLNKLAVLLGWTSSYVAVEYNYFQLCSIKTADFVCGEIPDINSSSKNETVKAKQQGILDEIRKATRFDLKHYDGWVDVSKYGESYFRVYARDGKNTFTLQSPAMIFRVTDEEDDYETLCYVVVWFANNNSVLKVQIHYKGYYIARAYLIKKVPSAEFNKQIRYEIADEYNPKNDLYFLIHDRLTDEIFRSTFFKIGAQIEKDTKVNTQLDDFAIIPLFNVMDSLRVHGVSDYDRFDSVVSQIQRSMTEVQLIFDKYTTPSMAVPTAALEYDAKTGGNIMEIGKAIGLEQGDPIPQFLEPDLSKLEMYFRQIEFNVTRIKELSEMGAALTSDANVSNISTETMKATFSSALKKSERLTTRNTDAIKQLFHLLSMYGYGEEIPTEDITITWYDGLPNSEEQDTNIASMKIEKGLSNRKEEYINRFNHTEDDFDIMWTQYLQEQSDLNTVSAAGMFNPFQNNVSGEEPDNANATTQNKPENDAEDGKNVTDDQTGEQGNKAQEPLNNG